MTRDMSVRDAHRRQDNDVMRRSSAPRTPWMVADTESGRDQGGAEERAGRGGRTAGDRGVRRVRRREPAGGQRRHATLIGAVLSGWLLTRGPDAISAALRSEQDEAAERRA